ncbi:RAMP superfamily CRISPR-associated protein [uncultured Psychromonas sp.]|uniref:RAMP superfamily CRISPR-associated protein n=1 Tax=uncultured Psychromonas sp. TaxID=173974 RepID=UPI00262BDCCC|nr:RAMP superfamily CRISPR-associated protein [uncultured Psychromonas sp.]
MNKYILIFDIKSDWHVGSGEEGGAYADALALKNHVNLPYLPGKSIKGLLRQAFETAIDNEWFTDRTVISELFGYENEGEHSQGFIQISSAQLSESETDYFLESKGAIKHLFRILQSTAIDKLSGVAKQGALRSIEVVVPMQLRAELTINGDFPDFQQWLEDALTLVTEFGAKRHRGLGAVSVSCQVKGDS